MAKDYVPAGAAVRFEPGDEKEVELIDYAGKREVYGFHNKVDGPLEGGEVKWVLKWPENNMAKCTARQLVVPSVWQVQIYLLKLKKTLQNMVKKLDLERGGAFV